MRSRKKSHEWRPQQVFDSRYVPSCVSRSCKRPMHILQTRIRNVLVSLALCLSYTAVVLVSERNVSRNSAADGSSLGNSAGPARSLRAGGGSVVHSVALRIPLDLRADLWIDPPTNGLAARHAPSRDIHHQ